MNYIKYFTIFFIFIFHVFSCDHSTTPNQNEISRNEISLSLPEFQEDFNKLDELAKIMAQKQNLYKVDMIEAMIVSEIKENIINLQTVVQKRSFEKNSASIKMAEEYVNKLKIAYDNSHEERHYTKNQSIEQLLSETKIPINSYFPVKSHRDNVLDKGQPFLVTVNPIIKNKKDEYFVRAFSSNGESKILSSKTIPDENILVLAYSENQELYAPAPPPPPPPPPPTVYYEGLRVTRVKTKGIDDGWLDGDLELRIKLIQEAAWIQSYYINGAVFTTDLVNHDAGHWIWTWTGTKWRESNKWSYINHYRRWSERTHYTIPGTGIIIYNDEFVLVVYEEDTFDWQDDDIGEVTIYKDTHPFGSDFLVSGGSEQCWVTLDSGSYAASYYGL